MSIRDEITREDREAFKSRKRALAKVASMVAALIDSSGYDDLFGYDITEGLTPAQVARLDWALADVQRRLWKLGAS